MKTVAIAGVGLIGASFGLALRKAGFSGEILGVSSPPAIEAGLRSGAITRAATLEEAAESAGLIYLAQPVDRILTTLETLGPIAPASCLITDAGSTKSAIVRKASEYVREASFLGGHPLAGKEQSGAEMADADLFRGRPYVLTPLRAAAEPTRDLRLWLERLGANVIEMSPAEHDAVLAFTSHLPQLLSTALAYTLARQSNPAVAEVFGPALLDMTRLALSPPEVWESIFATNKEHILTAFDEFLQSGRELRTAVELGDLRSIFAQSATFARVVRKLPSTPDGVDH